MVPLLLLVPFIAAQGSVISPQLASASSSLTQQLREENQRIIADRKARALAAFNSGLPGCKFGLTGDEPNGCLNPGLITKTPPMRPRPPGIQPFPGKTTLTVVSSTSTMQGDLKCDGDNDQIEIQTAIDNMNVTGGTVILSEGVFYINNQIFLCNDLTLVGQGMNKTILYVVDNALTYIQAGTIRGSLVSNVIHRDFQVHGNRLGNPGDGYVSYEPAYGKFGFFCEACTNILYERVGAVSNTGYGFDPHGTGQTMIGSVNVTFDDCWAYDNNWDGFAIDKVFGGSVKNSWSIANGRHGYNIITGSRDVIVENNYAYDNGFFYMKGDPGNGITVQSNAGLQGTYIYYTNSITVRNNTIGNSRGMGLYFSYCSKSSGTRNTISGMGFCVGAIDTTDVVIRSNTCIGGNGLKSENNTNLVSDLEVRTNQVGSSGATQMGFPLLSIFLASWLF